MLRISLKRTLDIDVKFCVGYMNWQKASDSVKWTKLMQILKGTGIDRSEKKYLLAYCAWIRVLKYD